MTEQPAEYAIPNTRVLDLRSAVTDRDLRLIIALPLFPAPAGGYRVLYVLDGNGYSATAAEAVRWNMNAPDVVVVGIGYPDTPEFIKKSMDRHGPPTRAQMHLPPFALAVIRERVFDLSLKIDPDDVDDHASLLSGTRNVSLTGGADALLDTIEQDIAPRIAQLVPINPNGSALFGHSLGGLAVLRALFTRPNIVRTFIAASPAIWWAKSAVLADEVVFGATVAEERASPRVLITMGADESSAPRQLPPGSNRAEVEKVFARANMVENARALVSRLKSVEGGDAYEVADYAVFPHQQHGLAVWPAIGRAVEFAFQH